MDTVVGAGVTIALGLFAIAAIYQLGKAGNPVAGDVTSSYNATLSNLFK